MAWVRDMTVHSAHLLNAIFVFAYFLFEWNMIGSAMLLIDWAHRLLFV